MTSDTIIKEVRVRLGDVDGIIDSAALDYTDAYLFHYVDASNNFLNSTRVITATYVVSGTTISPEPSVLDGLLLASYSAYSLLSSDLSKKVRNGELGIRFKSGQDEISTVEAAKKIEETANEAYKNYRLLVMARFSDSSLSMSRLQ